MARHSTLATILLAASLAAPAAQAPAQGTCRPNALGAVACVGPSIPRPLPREIFGSRKPGLARVQQRRPATAPEIIPAWRSNVLGTVLLDRSETPSGRPCRTDSLGNLICQ